MSNSIFEKLGFNDLEFDDIQSADEMTIIPIIGRDRTSEIAKPENLRFTRTTNYGSMCFENIDSDYDAIVPSNMSIITDQRAQDHAMSEPNIVKPKKVTIFTNACCIQSSQGGFIRGNDHQYDILPLELRLNLLSLTMRSKNDYSKLWNHIGKFISGIPKVTGHGEHLEHFFRPYKKELNDFIAEFEPVKNQIGAIILFTDKIAGIEILPTVSHWNYYWTWLIRGCYASQLLKLKLTNQINKCRLTISNIPDSIDEMKESINNSLNSTKELFIDKTRNINISSLGTKKLSNTCTNQIIKTNCGGGDLIIQNNNPIYLSMVECTWK